jgi:hypothetical protein
MLNELLREELKERLAEDRLEVLFDGYGKEEIVYEGMVGLNKMTDQQMVDELTFYADEDDELLIRVQVEVESHKLLIPTESI